MFLKNLKLKVISTDCVRILTGFCLVLVSFFSCDFINVRPIFVSRKADGTEVSVCADY